jgi:hypothetical protein
VTTIMSFDSSSNQFAEWPGASQLPGPVQALTIANQDGTELWAAGQGSDGTAYLQRYKSGKWLPVDSKVFGVGTDIRGIQILSLSNDHGKSDTLETNHDLLLMGQIVIPDAGGFRGKASGALFNGTSVVPLLLATKGADGSTTDGSLSSIFVENPNSFFMNSSKSHQIE